MKCFRRSLRCLCSCKNKQKYFVSCCPTFRNQKIFLINKHTDVLTTRIELKYCLISTSYLAGLFNIFILLHISWLFYQWGQFGHICTNEAEITILRARGIKKALGTSPQNSLFRMIFLWLHFFQLSFFVKIGRILLLLRLMRWAPNRSELEHCCWVFSQVFLAPVYGRICYSCKR